MPNMQSNCTQDISFTNLNVTTREFSIVAFESPDRWWDLAINGDNHAFSRRKQLMTVVF